jgi:hypothetical protein
MCIDVPEPDMYVIGFQEIVKLTARQIAVTDENKRRIWEREIENTINRRGGARYIQLRSVQLVGTALMIYVKEQNVAFIRNVECTMKKVTGPYCMNDNISWRSKFSYNNDISGANPHKSDLTVDKICLDWLARHGRKQGCNRYPNGLL